MSQKLLLIVAVLAHNLGSIVLVGSLIFVQGCYLPAVADARKPQVRMRLRLDAIGLLFGWLWFGVALIYVSGF